MSFTLRPGEAIEWRWGQGEKHHYAPNPVLFLLNSTNLHEWGPDAWATLRNGAWTYTPPLRTAAARAGVEAAGVHWTGAAKGPAVVPARAGEPASLVWKIRAPYAIVGGRLQARMRPGAAGGEWAFSVSHDGREWKEVSRGEAAVDANLDPFFPSPGAAHYEYLVRLEMKAARNAGALGLESITIQNDLQMAPLAMPSLELGENRILYTDETKGARAVRTTFEWEERTMPAPLRVAPLAPARDGEVEGTAVAFQWNEVPDAADYHFELSDEPGMRWALSPAFDVQLSQAKSKSMTRLSLPSAGLLHPGRRYYWRVRAKSSAGMWGPWSDTWTFVPQAPGIPGNLRFEEREPGALTLAWDAGADGRRPVRYRVYASDEKGFTASDDAREVATGNQKSRGLFPGKSKVAFPATFLAGTEKPFYALSPRHAFYRVRSGG